MREKLILALVMVCLFIIGPAVMVFSLWQPPKTVVLNYGDCETGEECLELIKRGMKDE